MDKTRIIVVDDNLVYCQLVCNLLEREGFRTVQAYHLSSARKLLQQATEDDIVVSDLRLPDGDGIGLLRWMRKEGMMQPFIIMTDYDEVHTAVESMKLGSLDYIPKQQLEVKLIPLLHDIMKEMRMGRNRMPVFSRNGSAFQAIMKRIRQVAPTNMSVLIFGENGTGKEHIAHHLHEKSKRSGKPFVAVDCGSLSKELAPSAFFGHVKGAFTGADSAKKGYFHEAEGGTLFLDERCSVEPDAPTDNWLIYGHNMRDGSMFGQLVRYRDEAFCQAHPTFTFDTLYETATWQVAAVLDTALGADELPYYTFFDADNKLDWQRRVAAITEKSLYDTGVTPAYGTQLLTLSTCGDTRIGTDARFALLAVRVG